MHSKCQKIVRRFTVDDKKGYKRCRLVNGIHGQSSRQTDKQKNRQADRLTAKQGTRQ
jgi:hypothetical protein